MRLEYKFLSANKILPELRESILPYVSLDRYAQVRDTKGYTVRSIYFDTSRMKYYHEKVEGLIIRKKLRIRGYNERIDQCIVFLEIKRKYDNYIIKNRAPLLFQNLEEFLKTRDIKKYILTDNGCADAIENSNSFLHHIFASSLSPTVLIVYEREAYYSRFNSELRITIDKNLRSSLFPVLNDLFGEEKLQNALRNYFIMEVKFEKGFPPWLQDIIKKFNFSRQALSKYTICLDAQRKYIPLKRKTTIAFTDRFINYNTKL